MAQNYKYLRLFPLNLVVFPNENLNLHIFEPRYKQLISECLAHDETFGIPIYKDKKITRYGTEIKILSLEKKYDGGEMDIKTVGVNTFKITELIEPQGKTLYHSANISYLNFDTNEDGASRTKLEGMIKTFFSLMSPHTPLRFNSSSPLSHQFGHKIGLSFSQEIELFEIDAEFERQQYMLKHLSKVLPVLQETERFKERIKRNGHFRKLTASEIA